MKTKKLTDYIQNGKIINENSFYDELKDLIEGFLKSKFLWNQTTEDDISEIITKVFLKINTFNESKSDIRTWVCAITKNHIFDKKRKNKNQKRFSTGNLGDVNLDSVINYSTNSLNTNATTSSYTYTTTNTFFDLTLVDIRNQISYSDLNISNEDFHMITMKYYYGYTYDEIGTELNYEPEKVSNRINYVKKKIKGK